MIRAAIYNQNKRETALLVKYARESVSHLSDESMDLLIAGSPEELPALMEEKAPIDIALLEVIDDRGISLAKQIRKLHKETMLMLISDITLSPMKYMTPEIRAASLLLRPYNGELAEQTIRDFFMAVFHERGQENESCFVLENQEGKLKIPFSQIYYFEINEKKIYVRLKNTEYCRYGTMEQLENQLKDMHKNSFLRCHRSYIINGDLISRVKLSEGLIYLSDQIEVPLSRSYKSEIKEYLNGLQK